jgi:hypothetical protein
MGVMFARAFMNESGNGRDISMWIARGSASAGWFYQGIQPK